MSTQVGTVVAGVRVERALGRGFLGESYLARRVDDGRQVVVKLLHDHFTHDRGFADRFTEIVRPAASIRHPHVVPIESFGEAGGRFYLIQPYLADGSLRGLLQRFKQELPLPRAVMLLRQVADGIAAAHAAGLLHRDLKPENVLLQRGTGQAGFGNATAQVADFGLTRLAELGATIGGNMAFGSLPYLSPEHFKGNVDARSDVYSLGVVLYEAVAVGPQFQVKTLKDAFEKHLQSQVPRPTLVIPSLPPALEQIVLRCLEKDPAARYPTAQAVEQALGQLRLAGEVVVNLADQAPPPVGAGPGRGRIIVNLGSPPAGPTPEPLQPPRLDPPPAPTAGRWQINLDLRSGGDPEPIAPSPPLPPLRIDMPSGQPAPPQAAMGWKVGAGGPAHIPVPLGEDQPFVPLAPAGGLGDSIIMPAPLRPEKPAAGRPASNQPRPKGRTSRLVMVVVETPHLTLTPDQVAIVNVTIANTSKRVEHFVVRVEGIRGPGGSPEAWAEAPAERIQLVPDGRATVPLTVRVPRAAENVAGEYQVDVSAVASVSGEVGTAGMTWTVLPYFDTSVVVTPARATGWRKASYSLAVTNHGNAMVRCAMSASDEDRALRYQLSQPEISLDQGVGATIALDVRGRIRPLGSMENRSCTIKVDRLDARSAGAPPEATLAKAQFGHRALVPTWVLPVALALAIAIYMVWPKTTLTIEVLPPNVAATLGIPAKVVAMIKNQKGERVPARSVSWGITGDTAIAQLVSVAGDTVTILPKRVGNTTITATAAKVAAVNVQIAVAAPSVETVVLAPSGLSLAIGETRRLATSVADANGRRLDRPVTWSSSDPSVATVGNGEVTAKAVGRAVITAQVEAKSATANVTVRGDSVGVALGGAAEDCFSYEPSLLGLKNDKERGWMVQHQGQALLRFDKKDEAERAMNLAKRYKQHCYVGRRTNRPDSTSYYVEYWKSPSDLRTEIKKEECLPYDRSQLQVVETGRDWELRAGPTFLVRAASKADADRLKTIAASHFAFCQLGQRNARPNHRLYMIQYWR